MCAPSPPVRRSGIFRSLSSHSRGCQDRWPVPRGRSPSLRPRGRLGPRAGIVGTRRLRPAPVLRSPGAARSCPRHSRASDKDISFGLATRMAKLLCAGHGQATKGLRAWLREVARDEDAAQVPALRLRVGGSPGLESWSGPTGHLGVDDRVGLTQRDPGPGPTVVALTGQLDTVSDRGPAADGITNRNQPTFTGTAVPQGIVRLFAQRSDSINRIPLGETVADPSGQWRLTIGPLADGTYTISGLMIPPGGSPTPTAPWHRVGP
jgi:hypothetical protein